MIIVQVSYNDSDTGTSRRLRLEDDEAVTLAYDEHSGADVVAAQLIERDPGRRAFIYTKHLAHTRCTLLSVRRETPAEKWDWRFLELARHIAGWSKDGTGVGAVVIGPAREVRSTGYNGFPPGVDDTPPERRQRPEKYDWTAHAEENAIAFAALTGAVLQGCTLYSTMFPCATCARLIIRAGIKRLVAPPAPAPIGVEGDWRVGCQRALQMFKEAGVDVAQMTL